MPTLTYRASIPPSITDAAALNLLRQATDVNGQAKDLLSFCGYFLRMEPSVPFAVIAKVTPIVGDPYYDIALSMAPIIEGGVDLFDESFPSNSDKIEALDNLYTSFLQTMTGFRVWQEAIVV